MVKLLSRVRFLVTIWLGFFLAPVAIAQYEDLHVAINPVENGVEFVLINTGEEAMSILTWETPLEWELTQNVFVITPDDGGNRSLYSEPAVFSGRVFKRADPTHKDFMQIAPGQSVRAVIPLADYYELPDEGGYQVSFRGQFQFQDLNQKDRSVLSHQHGDLESVFVSTNPISVNLNPVPKALFARAGEFTGCTASQLAELPLDFDASERITREAREALEGLPENERAASPRYQRWFGAHDNNRYASVIDTYTKAEALMASSQVEFVCDCDEPYFAFIRRTEPFRVNLCTFYWSARRTGTDSRAGTILHEVSHFNEVGGTIDFAYGQSDASNLAMSNPARAAANADSIEYFAENTPFLEISAGVAEPQASVEFETLEFGVAQAGSLVEGRFDHFEVAGADEIRLTTLSGDADLHIYSDRELATEICSSLNVSSVDTCRIDTEATIYISVLGFRDSSYNIVATKDSRELQAGQTQSASIVTGEQQFYTVTNSGFLQLESVTGDSDIYVYSSPTRSAETLVCDSRHTTRVSTIDDCEINGIAYVAILAIEGGNYTIAAFDSNPQAEVIEVEEPVETMQVTEVEEPVVTMQDTEEPVEITEVEETAADSPESETTVVATQAVDPPESGGGQFGSAVLALFLLLFLRRSRFHRAGFFGA